MLRQYQFIFLTFRKIFYLNMLVEESVWRQYGFCQHSVIVVTVFLLYLSLLLLFLCLLLLLFACFFVITVFIVAFKITILPLFNYYWLYCDER
jgi:hypothetical protein